MNRLVLIGNGFDLAHRLKTSYMDFINWYWAQWGKRLLTSNNAVESDEFCSFSLKTTGRYSTWFQFWNGPYIIKPDLLASWDVNEVARNDLSIFAKRGKAYYVCVLM